MKTNIYLRSYFSNFQTNVAEEIKSHILRSITFFEKKSGFMR